MTVVSGVTISTQMFLYHLKLQKATKEARLKSTCASVLKAHSTSPPMTSCFGEVCLLIKSVEPQGHAVQQHC